MKLLGVIMTYNDDDCLHSAIESLLESNHYVWVFDHGSIDSTKKVVDKYPKVTYQYVDRTTYPNFMKPGQDNIHHFITDFIIKKQGEFDWVTWIDSDEIICSMPEDSKSFYELINDAYRNGYDGIPGYLREYWATEGDDPKVSDFRNRITRFKNKGCGYCGGLNRTWRIDCTPVMTEGTLRHTFFNGLQLYPKPHLLKHYPIRTNGQGYQKINVDRQRYHGAGAHYEERGLANTTKLLKPKGWGQEN